MICLWSAAICDATYSIWSRTLSGSNFRDKSMAFVPLTPCSMRAVLTDSRGPGRAGCSAALVVASCLRFVSVNTSFRARPGARINLYPALDDMARYDRRFQEGDRCIEIIRDSLSKQQHTFEDCRGRLTDNPQVSSLSSILKGRSRHITNRSPDGRLRRSGRTRAF